MNAPLDPDLETKVLAAIREPLVTAIGRAGTESNPVARTRRLVAAACASILIVGAGAAAWRIGRGGDADHRPGVGPLTTGPSSSSASTPVTAPPPPSDPRAIVVSGNRTIHLRNTPRWVGSGVGDGVTATPDGRFVSYEYETPTAHEIAIVDTRTCAAHACTETVVARGHSPVLSAGGVLAYIALDNGAPGGLNEAMWQRSGSVTVRAPDGMTQAWGHDAGLQTVGWARNTLIVEHDVPTADTEGFEELMLYRGAGDRTVLTQGLVAISPDGARLLLGGTGAQMLALYDVAARRVVSSISIADYERALVPARELAGVDLSKWPGFEEPEQWPVTCCAAFTGGSLWHDDLVVFPSLHVDHRADGAPDRFDLRPTIVRITADRIVPLRALRTGRTGPDEGYEDVQWLPGSTTEFVLKRSAPLPSAGIFVRCRIDGAQAHCNEDPSLAGIFRRPTVSGPAPLDPAG